MSTNVKTLTATTAMVEIEKLGESFGGSSKAQIDSCKLFSKLANTGSLEGKSIDDACKEAATRFATGMERKSKEPVSEGSREVYAKQFKLFADAKVYKQLDDIVDGATKFVNATPAKQRQNKKLFPLIKQAASAVRKGKTDKIIPELFQGFCAAKAEPSKEDKQKAAKSIFREAVIALVETEVVDMSQKSDLLDLASALGIKVEFKTTESAPAPVVPATPDLNAIIAAAVAAALAGQAK